MVQRRYPRQTSYKNINTIYQKLYLESRDELYSLYKSESIDKSEFRQRFRREVRIHIREQRNLAKLLVSGLQVGNYEVLYG
ncbi:hypothetical protein J4408_02585 [Candidatus Pacearchaeota archaeon]|nr:hypothetical protein [Candidatus Pacearchaeota archaeon]